MSDMEPSPDQTPGSNASKSNARPIFVGLAVLTVVVGFIVTGREWPSRRLQPSDNEIKAEYMKVSAPVGTRTEREFEVHSKSGAVSVTNRHAANLSADVVLSEYRKALVENGWTYRKDFGDGRHHGQDYCKGKLLASVEIMSSQGQQSEYVFSVSWSGVSESECS